MTNYITKKPMYLFLQIIAFFTLFSCNESSGDGDLEDNNIISIKFGDPFVLEHEGIYYMYGTSKADYGIEVFKSNDLKNWTGPVGATKGYALHRDNAYGNFGFWAPEVYSIDNKFYMFYTTEEHLAIAVSDSPVGPFIETGDMPVIKSNKAIDSHLFIDDDGRKYMYYVAFTNGNVIWMCELNNDFLTIKENSTKECFGVSQSWEDSPIEPHPHAKVTEGAFMLKHNGIYYLVYSANHFENPNYGIGYATATKPTGPWTKYEGNPIIAGEDVIKGTGHCAFFNDTQGNLNVVYHSHFSEKSVQPRVAHINKCHFVTNPNGGPDILEIVDPRIVPVLTK